MEATNLKLSFAEKLIVTGNVLGAISTVAVFVGTILRQSDLKDGPLFNTTIFEQQPIAKFNKPVSQNSNYWSK